MLDEATIKIHRRWNFSASIQPFYLVVDDQQVGKIANGKIESFSLAQGHHSIFIRGTFGGKTQKIDFNVGAGETKFFECGVPSTYRLSFVFLLIYFAVVSFVLRSPDEHNYLRTGAFFLAILFAAIATFKSGSCYYLKEVQASHVK